MFKNLKVVFIHFSGAESLIIRVHPWLFLSDGDDLGAGEVAVPPATVQLLKQFVVGKYLESRLGSRTFISHGRHRRTRTVLSGSFPS